MLCVNGRGCGRRRCRKWVGGVFGRGILGAVVGVVVVGADSDGDVGSGVDGDDCDGS
jgi:hypothetical protein